MTKVKKRKIKTVYNYDHKTDSQGETFKKPTLTVPDQTQSLKTLLRRQLQGQSITTFQAVYNVDLPEIEKMDPMQRADLARNMKDQIKTNAKKATAYWDKVKKDLKDKEEEGKKKATEAAKPPEPPKKDKSE